MTEQPTHTTRTHRREAIKERQRQAVELRKSGVTLQTIADRLGYSSASTAARAIRTAINNIPKQASQELIALEVERLDHLQAIAWSKLSPKGQGVNLDAIPHIIKIMERRAKLLGLDHNETRIAAAIEANVILEAEKLQLLTHAFHATLITLGLTVEQQEAAPHIFAEQLQQVGLTDPSEETP